jgi:hypothetical protein
MDGPDLATPVRVSDMLWTARSRSNGRKTDRGDASPKLGFRRGFPARAALGVDGERATVRRDDEEDADVMQKRSASSKTLSASPIASCDEVEV